MTQKILPLGLFPKELNAEKGKEMHNSHSTLYNFGARDIVQLHKGPSGKL